MNSAIVGDIVLEFLKDSPVFVMNVPNSISITDVLAYPMLDALGVCACAMGNDEFLFFVFNDDTNNVIEGIENAEITLAPSVSARISSVSN